MLEGQRLVTSHRVCCWFGARASLSQQKLDVAPLSGRHFKKGSPKQSSVYKGLSTQSDTKVMAWKVPSLEKPKEKAHRLGWL